MRNAEWEKEQYGKLGETPRPEGIRRQGRTWHLFYPEAEQLRLLSVLLERRIYGHNLLNTWRLR